MSNEPFSDISNQRFFDTCGAFGFYPDSIPRPVILSPYTEQAKVNELSIESPCGMDVRKMAVQSIQELRHLYFPHFITHYRSDNWTHFEADWPIFPPGTASIDGTTLTSDELCEIRLAIGEFLTSKSGKLSNAYERTINSLLFPFWMVVCCARALELKDDAKLVIGKPSDPPYVLLVQSLTIGNGVQIEERTWTAIYAAALGEGPPTS